MSVTFLGLIGKQKMDFVPAAAFAKTGKKRSTVGRGKLKSRNAVVLADNALDTTITTDSKA